MHHELWIALPFLHFCLPFHRNIAGKADGISYGVLAALCGHLHRHVGHTAQICLLSVFHGRNQSDFLAQCVCFCAVAALGIHSEYSDSGAVGARLNVKYAPARRRPVCTGQGRLFHIIADLHCFCLFLRKVVRCKKGNTLRVDHLFGDFGNLRKRIIQPINANPVGLFRAPMGRRKISSVVRQVIAARGQSIVAAEIFIRRKVRLIHKQALVCRERYDRIAADKCHAERCLRKIIDIFYRTCPRVVNSKPAVIAGNIHLFIAITDFSDGLHILQGNFFRKRQIKNVQNEQRRLIPDGGINKSLIARNTGDPGTFEGVTVLLCAGKKADLPHRPFAGYRPGRNIRIPVINE